MVYEKFTWGQPPGEIPPPFLFQCGYRHWFIILLLLTQVTLGMTSSSRDSIT